MNAEQQTWWRPLVVLSVATFLSVTSEMLPAGVISGISTDLGVRESTAGLLVTAWALTVVLSSIPLVRATVRFQRRSVVVMALAALSVGNLLTALAPSYPVALAARAASAAAHGVFWAVVVAYAASLVAPERTGRALSIVLAGPSLAGLVGLPAAAGIADLVGWRGAFVLVAAGGLGCAVVIRLLVPSPAATTAEALPRGTWDSSARPVLVTALGGAAALVGHFAAFTFIVPLSRELGGASDRSIPVVLLASGLGGLVGVLVAGRIADRWPGVALPVMVGALAAALASLALPLGAVGYLVAVTAWGAAIGILPVVLQADVLRLASAGFQSLAGSVLITVLNLGMGLGAFLGSRLVEDLRALPLVAAAIVLVGVVPLVGLRAGKAGAPPLLGREGAPERVSWSEPTRPRRWRRARRRTRARSDRAPRARADGSAAAPRGR